MFVSESVRVSSPHIHVPLTVAGVMQTVMLALIPTTLFGIFIFGLPALFLLLLSIATAVVAEAVCLYLLKKPIKFFLADGSAILTGWLIALTLPPYAPWWIAVVGTGFAIVIGKHLYGGLGQNLFNPAMLARVMLLVAFPLEMTTWINPQLPWGAHYPDLFQSLAITFGGHIPVIDGLTGATPLGNLKTEMSVGHSVSEVLAHQNYWHSFIGWHASSLGESSSLLILLGGVYLLYKRVITWHIPVSMLLTSLILATVFNFVSPDRYADGMHHLFNGGAFLVAFFIATDPVTAPSTPAGRLLFGVGIGLIEYLIRTWGSFPEGVGFAVLLMNALTPLIEHYIRPRIYGRTALGKPLEVQKRQA